MIRHTSVSAKENEGNFPFSQEDSHRIDDFRPQYCYQGYGLSIKSDFKLPWPEQEGFSGKPDVSISHGEVPEVLDSPHEIHGYFQVATDTVLLNAVNFVRCLITDGGRQVQIDNRHAVICILDSILSVCLHLRSVLALNASAIATRNGAVLFVGSVDKSILVAALGNLGYPLVADGIVGIMQKDGTMPKALPGFPQIYLWKHAIKSLENRGRVVVHPQVRPGIECYRIPAQRFHSMETSIHAIYFLAKDSGGISSKPLARSRTFSFLTENTSRRQVLCSPSQRKDHFRIVSTIAQQSAASRLSYPIQGCPSDTLASTISECLPPPS